MSLFVEGTIPPYPDGTPYLENKNGTYWPNLSEASQKALDFVAQYVVEHGISMSELNSNAVDDRLTMLRYLRANNFDTKKTVAHMIKNVEWRRNMKVQHLVTQRPEEILGFNMPDLTCIFPHWQYGFDKTGRPVIYKQYGKFDAGGIKKMSGGNYDRIIQYHVWEQEAVSRLCLQQTRRLGRLVETSTGIVDVKDMTLWQITRDFLALTRSIADVDQGQYPETLGRIYILNAPSAFPYVYGMVRPWLDPVVAAKIFVLGGPKEYEPVLIDFIGKENLPSNYGGDLPPLDVTVHPYAYTMEMEYDGKVVAGLSADVSFVAETASTVECDDSFLAEEEGEEAALRAIEKAALDTPFHPNANPNHDAEGHLVQATDLCLDEDEEAAANAASTLVAEVVVA